MKKEEETSFTLLQKIYAILMEDRYCCGNTYEDLDEMKPLIKETLDREQKAMNHKNEWWDQ
jgi:hypothetical protein